jgi:capsule polysaccharide export protein KpsE/RkpR
MMHEDHSNPLSDGMEVASPLATSGVKTALRMLCVALQYWKSIIVTVILFSGMGVLLALLLSERFVASTTVMMIGDQGSSLGSSLLSALPSEIGNALGGSLGGSVGKTKGLLETVLSSEQMADSAVNAFQLDTAWGLDKQKVRHGRQEICRRMWHKAFQWQYNENDAYVLSFESKDPLLSFRVLQWVNDWSERKIWNLQQAKINRSLEFAKSKLSEREKKLRTVEDSLQMFQLKHKMYDPTAQIEQSLANVASLQADAEKLKIQEQFQAQMGGAENSAAMQIRSQRLAIEKHLAKMGDEAAIGEGLKAAPTANVRDAYSFYRLQRDVKVQSAIRLYLIQEEEQLAMELEKKSTQYTIIDPPTVPSRR